jgi:iron complex outermembrane receptor protein
MKTKILLLSLLLAATSYAKEDVFYEEADTKGSSVRLEESVVSTTGYETTVRNTTKNLTVISNEDIEGKNYSEITEVLKKVPGITVNSDVFGTSIDLRGQGTNKSKANVQILIDGVNINPLDTSMGILPLDNIPVDNIERIEVLPGGGSVLYGDGTVGGVVNIITKIEAGKVYNSVGARVGNDNAHEFNMNLGQKLTGKLAVQINYNDKSGDGYRDDSGYDKKYFEGAVNYNLNEKNNLTFKYSRMEEERKLPKSLTRQELDEDRKQSGEKDGEPWTGSDLSEVKRDVYSLNYKSELTDKITFDLDTSYQKTDNTLSSIMEVYEMPTFKTVGQNSVGTFTDEKIIINPKLNFKYGDESELILGFDYKNNKGERGGEPGYLGMYRTYEYDMEKETFGGYALNKYKIGNFEFIQGYRREKSKYEIDRYSDKYTFGPPMPLPNTPGYSVIDTFNYDSDTTNDAYELGVNYLYSDTGNVYTRFEGGFRTPGPSEFIDKDKATGDYIFNDLQSETYNTLELGLKDYVFNSYISATAFYTETKDEIVQNGNMPYDWKFYNIGKTRRTGVELFAEQYIGKLTISEGFTYIDAKIKKSDGSVDTSGNYVPGVSKYTGNISLTYNFNKKLSLGLNTIYRDGYYLNEENTNGKVNEYIVTDMTINYILDNGLKLYAGINNIFNEMYYTGVYEDSNSSDGKSYNPAAERSYYVGFKYNF